MRQEPREVNGVKRKAMVLGTAAALVLLFFWIRGCLLPEEERIRRVILSMADGFNRSRAGQVVDPLAEKFIEETAHRDRTDVRGYLGVLFLTQRDPATKEFRYRVEVDAKDVTVAIDAENPGLARATVAASFLALGPGGGREPVWRVEISASLERTDEGWKITRSSHRTLGGKRPF
jgi:hypothetical protein